MSAGDHSYPALVSSTWLKENLDTVILLEVHWGTNSKQDYIQKGHIQNAQILDLSIGVHSTPLIPRNLPQPSEFESNCQLLGICQNSHVVVYDRDKGQMASRAWLTFKKMGHDTVSLLDGGMTSWQLSGEKLVTGDTLAVPTKGDFRARVQEGLVTDYKSVRECQDRNVQLLDVRLPKFFNGEAPEPSPNTVSALTRAGLPLPEKPLLSGHMKGALNMPETTVLDPTNNCLLDQDSLRKVFHDHKVDLCSPLVVTCYTGTKACLVAFTAIMLGNTDTHVYTGSWTEWAQMEANRNLTETNS